MTHQRRTAGVASVATDATHTFSATEFNGGFADADAGDAFGGIELVTYAFGLLLNGSAVTSSTNIIAAADIGNLTYEAGHTGRC